MKKILLISLLFITACSAMQERASYTQQYVYGTEDLPVYEGFIPSEKKNVAYDSATGRIIDANYYGNKIKNSDIIKFYDETLPQLGWKKKKANEYVREGELLKINTSTKNGTTFLKFTIRPTN